MQKNRLFGWVTAIALVAVVVISLGAVGFFQFYTQKADQWVTLRSVVTSDDSYSYVDNSSARNWGDATAVRYVCTFGTSSGSATVTVYGFPGDDNQTDILAEFPVTATSKLTARGRYASKGETVDLGVCRKTIEKITAIADNVTLLGAGQ